MPDFNPLKHYRGKLCPHGHSLRYRSNHRCVVCMNDANTKRDRTNYGRPDDETSSKSTRTKPF